MNRFAYTQAPSIAKACDVLAGNGKARVIAGGSNIVDLIKAGIETPELLVDISRVVGLDTILETQQGDLRIGAMVRNATLASDSRVRERFPLLAKAILAGASPQLRNAATTGGNLNQRTRCYYFNDLATPCNKREPGTGCSAIEGRNRIHAILGTSSHCIATHPSDMCVALAALEAKVEITSPRGVRNVPMADYHRLPGDAPHIDTTLASDEVVTAVALPAASGSFAGHSTYLKLRDRQSYAFALVSVAAAVVLEGTTVMAARVALGGVAHKPWRRTEAEALLVGKPASEAQFAKAAEALIEGAEGYADNRFKIELARRAIVRALATAVTDNDSGPAKAAIEEKRLAEK